MIRVFCIDGLTAARFVEWDDTPTEGTTQDEYVFSLIQQWCETDMAKPCHVIERSDGPVTFWCDEDALLKDNPVVTFRIFSGHGEQRYFNKIVAVCHLPDGNFASIGPDAELWIKKHMADGTYQFPILGV